MFRFENPEVYGAAVDSKEIGSISSNLRKPTPCTLPDTSTSALTISPEITITYFDLWLFLLTKLDGS
ncbi:MAG: hypothetical protein U2M67_16030 [Methanosarcina sp.]|nr:hypothetical protein [Methanosarcina sp.]MDY9927760.1 hypothetical protein [Methanosarcina sp.]